MLIAGSTSTRSQNSIKFCQIGDKTLIYKNYPRVERTMDGLMTD